MEEYNKLYARNKLLDKFFMNKYKNEEDKYYEKNCLELIVELCEFANESKCFKYWSVKKANKELLLEEYADSLLMVLYMFNTYNIDSVEVREFPMSLDILGLFNELIRMCTLLMGKCHVDGDLLKNIFSYLYNIGKMLDLNDDEILDACYKKIEKNEERLNSNY